MKRPAYTLLKKIIRMRSYLLTNNIGKRNLELINKLDKISIWVNAWPNASEHNCINYVRNHYNDLLSLLPSCRASEKLVTELNTLIK